jgi:hypothetical protein
MKIANVTKDLLSFSVDKDILIFFGVGAVVYQLLRNTEQKEKDLNT